MDGKDLESVKADALVICRDYLGGPWQGVTMETFRFDELRGGLLNSLYLCGLPVDADGGSGPREAVLRFYGDVQTENANLVASESVTFVLLSERGLGPKLYALFPGGRLEQYIPSHYLNLDEMRLYACSIARLMARVHCLEVPVRKKPDLLNFFEKWLAKAEEMLREGGEGYSMTCDEFGAEVQWLKTEMERSTSPVVYCHNDLQGGNILYREDVPPSDRPSLLFIDFEFGAYNYRSYDFASHFVERCYDNDVPEYPHFTMDPSGYPSEAEQMEFLQAYVSQMCVEKGDGAELDFDLPSVLREIALFACMAQLMAGLWAASMANSGENKPKIGYREYEKVRVSAYKKFKEQYLCGR